MLENKDEKFHHGSNFSHSGKIILYLFWTQLRVLRVPNCYNIASGAVIARATGAYHLSERWVPEENGSMDINRRLAAKLVKGSTLKSWVYVYKCEDSL